MAGATLALDYRDALQVLLAIEETVKFPQAMLQGMGEKLLELHQQRFAEQKSLDGTPWQSLSARYQKRKRKNADKILTRDGYLRNTLRWQVNANQLLFGTDRVYGAIHQFGGTIQIAARSQQAYYRTKRNSDGKTEVGNQFVSKKKSNFSRWHTLPNYSITIPARPWLGISATDTERLLEIARRSFQRKTGG
ncbi:phage virion morphogenesis protein [Pectobacterium carotovorum]|uniref:phage virion morphogenesis protein n=1 Tax=Pectobacterium carotovorum TaxID=554 RepID=UPI000583C582|nr:phage virion morphogenesis protein [Pectobacterium carotovorum]KHS86522.1 bacteriophage protein [Pectobacterium carotovorum subsp. carotovorum]